MKPAHAHSAPPRRLTRWHVLTISLLFLGYGGYYFCRSDYSVALPLIIAEEVRKGTPANVAQVRLGTIASFGVLAYAIGKFPSGGLADRFGGRRNFLGGMFGSIVFTVLFMVGGGFPVFTLAWLDCLWQCHGSAQSQLPFRRCDFSRHHVAPVGARFRVERSLRRRSCSAQRASLN
jgi:sugar phosphate permease